MFSVVVGNKNDFQIISYIGLTFLGSLLFRNMAAAYMAKRMGIPFGFFTAGVNANDFTDIAFKTGLLAKNAEPMKMTLSEAINIQLPYNLERLLFYVTDEKHDLIKRWYGTLHQEGSVQLESEWLRKLNAEFRSAKVQDDELCQVLQEAIDEFDYWMDPHTGVAFAAAKQWGYLDNLDSKANKTAVAIMATASPCKFQSSLTVALGEQRWKVYETYHFPEQGRTVLGKSEVSPCSYPRELGTTVEATQKLWEQLARDLIMSL